MCIHQRNTHYLSNHISLYKYNIWRKQCSAQQRAGAKSSKTDSNPFDGIIPWGRSTHPILTAIVAAGTKWGLWGLSGPKLPLPNPLFPPITAMWSCSLSGLWQPLHPVTPRQRCRVVQGIMATDCQDFVVLGGSIWVGLSIAALPLCGPQGPVRCYEWKRLCRVQTVCKGIEII